MRLSKYLAECGVASRRKAEEIILAGRISVNGRVIKELGTKVDPMKDKVTFDGKIVILNTEKVYYLLNKPAGYTSTTKDPHAKHTVLELVPKEPRVFPVGRLDKDTTGLLILTNDGELAQKLTHPKYEKEKEYEVSCNLRLTPDNVHDMEKGMTLEGRKTAPAILKSIHTSSAANIHDWQFHYSITIKEGRNKQIRKMFDKVGKPVVKLKRIRVDSLPLGKLKEGTWRKLSRIEVDNLRSKEYNETI